MTPSGDRDPDLTEASELTTAAERLADRLRVVGPRFAAREGQAAAAVLDDVRAVLQRLADLGADAERRPRRPLPILAAHALGDQLLVLSRDVAVSGGRQEQVAALRLVRDLAARI